MHFCRTQFGQAALMIAWTFLTTASGVSAKNSTPKEIDIAQTVLLYQRSNGGWPKNYRRDLWLSKADQKKIRCQNCDDDSTFDNGATYSEMKLLAQASTRTGNVRYQRAFLQGLDFTLAAQYQNGGWPQRFPLRCSYSDHITFNDDAMIGVLQLLKAIASDDDFYGFVDHGRRRQCSQAIEKGVQCILKCQIRVDGQKTAWCAQHDAVSFEPQDARTYELRSISGKESVGIVKFLMEIDSPSPAVIDAIQCAVAWFDTAKLTGIRIERKRCKPYGSDRFVVKDSSADPLWARFYEIGTNRPFFCSRDGIPKESLAQISHERRNGYSWYSSRAAELLDVDFPAWQMKVAP